MRILIVEHDTSLGAHLKKEFDAERIGVHLASDGDGVASAAASRNYETGIIDIDLPNGDGFAILRQLRSTSPKLPILILGAGSRAGQRALALDLGADDFLPKPFEFAELLARVRALLRRSCHRSEAVLRFDDLELSREDHVVTRAGRRIRLTPKEFALLECLLANAGQCVTRSEIVRHVWHDSNDPLTNIVDVYVNYLRKKVDVPFEPKLIHTVRGVGYQLEARGTSAGKVA